MMKATRSEEQVTWARAQGRAQGLAEGRAEGVMALGTCVFELLLARGFSVSAEALQQIETCCDLSRLRRLAVAVATASSAQEALGWGWVAGRPAQLQNGRGDG